MGNSKPNQSDDPASLCYIYLENGGVFSYTAKKMTGCVKAGRLLKNMRSKIASEREEKQKNQDFKLQKQRILRVENLAILSLKLNNPPHNPATHNMGTHNPATHKTGTHTPATHNTNHKTTTKPRTFQGRYLDCK